MGKDSDGSPRRLRELLRRIGIEHRGGFEGLENVPPPTPSQVPVVVVDGVPVKARRSERDASVKWDVPTDS